MAQVLLFDKSLQKINFVHRITGINMQRRKRKLKQNCIFLFNFLWHQTDIIFALLWVLHGVASGKDLVEITYVAPCLSYAILAEIKHMIMFLKESKVHDIIDQIRELEIDENDFTNAERNQLIKPEIKLIRFVINLLNVSNTLVVTGFNLCPLIFMTIKYFTTGHMELMLPLLEIYPFDALDIRYWPFAYIHQCWTTCIANLKECATDYFFFTCCTHIRIQFKLLQHQFQQIADNTNAADQTAKFKKLIKKHQKVISITNMLEEIYSKSTLFNFVTSSVVICLTGFNVTTVDDKELMVTFIAFLFMSLVQIFFLCLFGDLLMSSSLDVADAVYNSKWYLSDVKMQRNILLVQTRAQTPCKLTAAGYADVNLRAYMKVISTSWSYFALLQTIYSTRS